MEREQGSLQDRLRDFGREPKPEILASLQSQLAERRGKKRPAWWLLAAAIVFVSGVSTTFFNVLDLEQNPQQTISESTGKDVPLAGRTEESLSSSTTNSRSNHQTETNNLNPAQKLADITKKIDHSVKEVNENQPDGKSKTKQKNHHSDRAGHLLATISTKPEDSKVHASANSESAEADEPSSEPITSQEKNSRRRTGFGKSSRHLESSFAIRNSQKGNTPAAKSESKPAVSVEGQIGSSSRKPVYEGEPNLSNTAKPVRDQNLKTSDTAPTQPETVVVSVMEENTNPKAEINANDLNSLKKDSIAKASPKDTVLIATSGDSVKVTSKKRHSFSVLSNSRYSAVRYYAINQEKSEFRNQLTNENGAFPSRMSFEAGCRFEYQLTDQFSVFSDLDLGYGKEDLYLLATSAVPGQFDRTVSGNSLVLNPKQNTQKEHIASSIWYSSLLAGFGIHTLPQLPVIRGGAGMQFLLMSDVTRKLDGSTLSNDEMSGPAGVGFLRISAAKEIPLGTKGRLVVEPMVQYFLNPVYRMKAGTSILPLQTGLQVGWKW